MKTNKEIRRKQEKLDGMFIIGGIGIFIGIAIFIVFADIPQYVNAKDLACQEIGFEKFESHVYADYCVDKSYKLHFVEKNCNKQGCTMTRLIAEEDETKKCTMVSTYDCIYFKAKELNDCIEIEGKIYCED